MFSFRTTCILFTLVNYVKVVQWPRYTEARILYSYALKKKMITWSNAFMQNWTSISLLMSYKEKTFANINNHAYYVTQRTRIWILGGLALVFVVLPVMMLLTEQSKLIYNSHFIQLWFSWLNLNLDILWYLRCNAMPCKAILFNFFRQQKWNQHLL